MNTPFDLEERLRDTLADIVPQLIARAEAPTEVALLGEPAPARPQIAGTPRRWSILGAVAAVAAFVAVVYVVSRPDGVGPATSPATSVAPVTTADAPAGEPAWYAALRPYVPERFQYLALVGVGPDSAMFEAIDPNSPVLLRISVFAVEGVTQVNVVCDDGRTNLGGTAGCSSAPPASMTDAEMLAIIDTMPRGELLRLTQESSVAPLAVDDVVAALGERLVGSTRLAKQNSGASLTLLYGYDGVPDTEVHVVSGLWPVAYSGGGSAWALSNTYAARATTTLPATGSGRTLLAYTAVIAAQGRATSTTWTPEWYTILREATPERFGYLAITRVEPHLATFVAIDIDSGDVLDLIVRDVPGPAVEVTCTEAAGGACSFTEADTGAMIGDIPPGALGAAARNAGLSSVGGAADALEAAAPGWTVVDVAKWSDADVTYRLSAPDQADLTVRMIATVLPVAVQAVVHSPVPGAAWVVYGGSAWFVSGPDSVDAAAILTALLHLDGA